MTTSGTLTNMYKLQNKLTRATVFGLRYHIDNVKDRSSWNPKLDPIWEEFLLDTPYSIQDDNLDCYLKLYGSLKVRHGDWVLLNDQGFYFPITQSILTTLYEFAGAKPEEL